MGRKIYLSEMEIFVTCLWLDNACACADESAHKTVIEKVLRKLESDNQKIHKDSQARL